MNFLDSPEKNISTIVSCLADDRVARGGEHVQLGHLGEHLEDLGLLQGVVGDVQDRELLAALQLPDIVACLQFIPSRRNLTRKDLGQTNFNYYLQP